MSVAIGTASAADRARVEEFYRAELGRDVPLAAEHEVLVALRDGSIVAALRLCPEAGTLLLRTVVVARDRRGQGIGRELLREASRVIGPRECWCFPWVHLEHFYSEIGLVRVPESAIPTALRHRYEAGCIATYRAGGVRP